jgi:hypothetical protein
MRLGISDQRPPFSRPSQKRMLIANASLITLAFAFVAALTFGLLD